MKDKKPTEEERDMPLIQGETGDPFVTDYRIIVMGMAGSGDQLAHSMVDAQEERAAVQGAHMLLIPVVLGDRDGADVALNTARLGKESGALTVVLAISQPADEKDALRALEAVSRLQALKERADTLIVLRCACLAAALRPGAAPDDVLVQAKGILESCLHDMADMLRETHLMYGSVDLEDVRSVLKFPGWATLGVGCAGGEDRARVAVESALTSPLLRGVNLANAQGVLVIIGVTQGSLRLREVRLVLETVRAGLSPEVHVIYGVSDDGGLKETIRVTVIATGLPQLGELP